MIAETIDIDQVDILQRYLLGSFTLEYHDHICDTPSFVGEKLKVQIDIPSIEITTSQSTITGKVKTGSLNVVLINSQGKYFTDIDHFYSEIWNFLDDYVEISAEVIDLQNLHYNVRFDVYLRGSAFKIKLEEDLPYKKLLKEENVQLSLIREKYKRKEMQKYALEAFLLLRDLLDVKLDIQALIKTESRFLDDLILQKYREKYQKIHERQDIVKNLRIPNVIDGTCRFTEESVHDFRAQLPNNDESVPRIRVRPPIYKKLQIGEERALQYHLADDPRGLQCQLRDFQKQGLNWMLYREGYITETELNNTITTTDRVLHPNWSAFEVEGKMVYFNEMNGLFSWDLPPMLKVKGGILADEMGLGKSVQSIALILATKNLNAETPRQHNMCGTLLIVQKSTLGHWENLFKQHVKGKYLETLQYYEAYIRNDKKLDLSVYDVVISTYDVVGIDHEKDGILFKQKWDRVILDEAHHIKGRDNRCSRACFSLETDARWCLTGTPLQNNLTELFSLFHFLKVDTFSDYHWFNNYIIKPEDQRKVYVTIHQILQPIMLRRTKLSKDLNGEPIIKLPEKKIQTIWVTLDPEERQIYDTWFQKSSQKFRELLTNKRGVKLSTVHILAQLSFLRQICDNPVIFLKKAQQKLKSRLNVKYQPAAIEKLFEGFFKEQNTVTKQLQHELQLGNVTLECCICLEPLKEDIVVFECAHANCQDCAKKYPKGCSQCRDGNTLKKKFLTKNEAKTKAKQEKIKKALEPPSIEQFQNKETSSKMLAVLRELEILAQQNQKVVIFTQFKCILNHLQSLLIANKYRFCRLDGGQTNQERTDNIERFQTGKYQVFLASLKAGSLGIDLTMANNVFIVDPWWNPSVENQASDRVHRFNQNKPVQIFHFICEKTIEERVLQIQEQKAQLIGKTLSDADIDSVLSFKERLELIFN